MSILSLVDNLSAEELGKLILGERDIFIRDKAQRLLDELLDSEISEFFASAVNDIEGNFRNGYYYRTIKSPYGELTLRMPRDRLAKFKTKLLEPYQRTTKNIGEMIQKLYVRGMTETEIVDQLSDEFGIALSRETIRKKVRMVLGDALSFNTRIIPDCAIVYLDGVHVPIKRRNGDTSKVEKECVMVALGVTKDGRKSILGFYFTPNEGSWAWDDVLKDLKSRGLYSPSLFVTDGLQGMPEAIRRNFPMAKHQKCLVHQSRTICHDVRVCDRKKVAADFRYVYSASGKAEAERRLMAFEEKWGKTYPSMVRKLKAQEDLFTFMDFPEILWKTIYTSNTIESFNAKLKRLTRKRILLNSEENAIITIASCCAEYNKNAGRITLRHFGDLTEEQKKGIFLPN